MTARPLDGIRVADVSWFGAGPITARALVALGAEVVRVESETKMDGLRSAAPFALEADGTPKQSANVSGYFNNFNAGKLSLAVDLNTERGQEIVHRLVERSDIFVTNFTPRVIEKWNLRYGQLRAVNPRIIASYSPMMGLEGPQRDFLGFGGVLTPITGFNGLSGFPDRDPIGVGTNYPDYVINPGHAVTAILAALRYRNRTGKGQCIEVPQIESVINALGAAVPAYFATGIDETRAGNRDAAASPHGVFRCLDEAGAEPADRWVAIACRNDHEWQELCAAIGAPDAATDARFATSAARRVNEDDLEATVGAWTRGRTAEAVMEALQARGVPAGVVQNARDILERDAHVRARGYYEYLDHPEAGRTAHDGFAARLSETPARFDGPAPCLGADSWEVCERILGYTADEIAALLGEGVLR